MTYSGLVRFSSFAVRLMLWSFVSGSMAYAAPSLKILSMEPYAGAIALDAATGNVLLEENADVQAYPASMTKLMDLLIIIERVENGTLKLDEPIEVTAEASKTGGSQVYLKEKEIFSLEEMLYALMIQSANDAAVALALHIAGSKEAFVDLMNQRARDIGMKSTVFNSVHGLPPGKDQQPDVSTPRDMAELSRELLRHPDALRFTSVAERPFRADTANPFIMRNHNHLLLGMKGVDGLKTGYFTAAGFSIAATATREHNRVIAVVMGSTRSKVRDNKARELLSRGLTELARVPAPTPTAAATPTPEPAPMLDISKIGETAGSFIDFDTKSMVILLLLVVIYFMARSGHRRRR